MCVCAQLETRCDSALSNKAVEALYQFSARLYPLVQCGTIASGALVDARQRLYAFRSELAALDEHEKRRRAHDASNQNS